MRNIFTDFAARNTAGFDYLSESAVSKADYTFNLYNPKTNEINPYIAEAELSSNDNLTFSPSDTLAPRGWAYNVIKLTNTSTTEEEYTITFTGDSKGSDGATSHFEGRIIKMGNNPTKFSNITMTTATNGEAILSLSPDDKTIFIVIASVPEYFYGNQNYDYNIILNKLTKENNKHPPIATTQFTTINKLGMTFKYRVLDNNLDIELTGPTTGWIGIGFNHSNVNVSNMNMKDSNIILGYVNNNTTTIQDSIGDYYSVTLKVDDPDQLSLLGDLIGVDRLDCEKTWGTCRHAAP